MCGGIKCNEQLFRLRTCLFYLTKHLFYTKYCPRTPTDYRRRWGGGGEYLICSRSIFPRGTLGFHKIEERKMNVNRSIMISQNCWWLIGRVHSASCYNLCTRLEIVVNSRYQVKNLKYDQAVKKTAEEPLYSKPTDNHISRNDIENIAFMAIRINYWVNAFFYKGCDKEGQRWLPVR